MICTDCRCEFVGWSGRCPVCRTRLVAEWPAAPSPGSVVPTLPYEALVNRVAEAGGSLSIDLSATGVAMERRWSFPFFGFGYAWARRMEGALDDLRVELVTQEVGRHREQRFPYYGYGFAWVKRMEGTLAGQPLALAATRVRREKRWRFPYAGFGFAWAEELAGECGEGLDAELHVIEVGRKKEFRFPYLGYGFAWEKGGVLILSIVTQ